MASEEKKTKDNVIQPNANFIDPEKIFPQVELQSGMQVADFGCGAGYFSLAAARRIGDGTVQALDVLPAVIEAINSQAKMQGLNNIVASRVNLEKIGGSKLPDGSIDFVIIKDMLFQNGNKDVILKEAGRVLKSGGRAIVVEWKKEATSIGPELSLRISKDELCGIIRREGFEIEKDLDAGDFHFGLLIKKE